MSVNKPLPATPGVSTRDPLAARRVEPSTTCTKQLQYNEDELSKRLSVALFANKSAFSRPLQVNHPLSPEEKSCGLAAKGGVKSSEDNEPRSQKLAPSRHPPVALSYYNSRLAPIQKKEVLPTSYHGVYQGVPLVDEVIPVTWKPWDVDSATADDAHRPAAKVATTVLGQSALTPVSAVPTSSTSAAKTGVKATVAASAVAPGQGSDLPRQKNRTSRAQSSRSRKRSSVAHGTQPTRRPQTSMQEAHAKHYTEWRDIHVQSLSRVDSILREAVGLRPSNPSRWSTCALPSQGPEGPASPPHSGLGISVSQSTGLPRLQEAGSRSLTTATSQAMYSHLAPDASTPAFDAPDDSSYYSSPRPNTSSACLATPAPKQSLLDSHQYSRDSAAQSAQAAATARPARLHTASSLGHSHADTRGTSMYLAGQALRPATTHDVRRQMSMYNPSGRLLRLSRDETRRSRLFAEYEMLMAGKDSGEDNDEEADDTATIDETDEDAVLVGMPIERNQGSLDDISEDAEYDFASYEPSPVDNAVVSDPCKGEKEASLPQPTLLVDKRKPIYAARPRPATVFGLSGPTLREARNNQTTSMYSSADILSKRLAEKRWSRTIIQNQHLFRAQTIAEQMDLEPVFGEDDGADKAVSDLEASPPPRPLELDFPSGVDLYQDVTQALAECLPPLSARSTTSTLSAATMAVRNEHAVSVAFPLTGAQFLSLQADAAFGAPTFTEKKRTRRAGKSSNEKASGVASDESAVATEKSSPHGSATEKRESVYINSDDLFDSAILAEAELPYQQEHGTAAGAGEYTPTIAASSLPSSEKLHINFDTEAVTELDIVALSAVTDFAVESEHATSAAHLNVGRHSSDSLSAPMSAPPRASQPLAIFGDSPRPSAKKSSTTECLSEATRPKLGPRHSEIIRQQLRYVEGHTPATKLGSELSKSDDEHRQMLEAYMKRFDFCDQPVDFALRQLFQELHLPAESQQIDRVITSFAERYHQCNHGLFYSADIVYAYAFAILLLHTDAHNPKVKHKISKAQFVARAKLLDEHKPGQDSEMFDEVLDILYENITMVKFEYAPSSTQHFAVPATQRPATSQGIGMRQYHNPAATADHARDQSPGISGWLRRVFAPISSANAASRSPLNPQDIPSKEQYSYSSLPRRRFAPVGLGPVSPVVAVSNPQLPPTPTISRPSTSHGTVSRSTNADFLWHESDRESVDNYEYSDNMLAGSMASLRLRANTVAPSVNIPQISPLATDFAMTYSSPMPSEGKESNAILLGRTSSSTFYTAPSDDGQAAAQDSPRPTTARPFRSSPLVASAGTSQGQLTHIPSSPESDGGSSSVMSSPGSPRGPHLGLSLSTTFAAADVTASVQPLVVETIRLSGVKSHVKRRVSLRQGRPLSGIIYQKPSPSPQQQLHEMHHATIGCAATAGSSISAAVVAAATASASSAQLRVDMSGRVSRKMERLDNGRRGLVRRWKEIWMVLSGSRLYFFRSNDAAQSEGQQSLHGSPADMGLQQSTTSGGGSSSSSKPAMSIQTIVPLREGVAIVDAAYKKYPHVFRILAGDGSQVLIKAPSDDAVAEWMARINCAAAFKTMEIERRSADSSAATPGQTEAQRSEQRARLLETKLAALDEDLNVIDDRLERSLRLFKQLVAMVPLTRHGRTKTVQYASTARERLKELYMSEQRLTCYKDVLELDLAIEYELGAHGTFDPQQ
ncbi:hypothetical protein GGI20_003584 [Coemansia sp. BCRC 34301]|nr:hypothetical protein GGI20_003584 [Coemansia sp. BCRC 34301]